MKLEHSEPIRDLDCDQALARRSARTEPSCRAVGCCAKGHSASGAAGTLVRRPVAWIRALSASPPLFTNAAAGPVRIARRQAPPPRPQRSCSPRPTTHSSLAERRSASLRTRPGIRSARLGHWIGQRCRLSHEAATTAATARRRSAFELSACEHKDARILHGAERAVRQSGRDVWAESRQAEREQDLGVARATRQKFVRRCNGHLCCRLVRSVL
jgi:hypothetical protein